MPQSSLKSWLERFFPASQGQSDTASPTIEPPVEIRRDIDTAEATEYPTDIAAPADPFAVEVYDRSRIAGLK